VIHLAYRSLRLPSTTTFALGPITVAAWVQSVIDLWVAMLCETGMAVEERKSLKESFVSCPDILLI